tara:strand:+ start:14449 stop:14730 length:282 start_codon:yes stop_codon:yes gene_type:complete
MEDNKIVDSLDAVLDSPENTQEVIDDRVLIKQEDITAVLNENELMRIKVTNQALQRTVKELAVEVSRLKGILKMQGENINKPKAKEKANATNG